MSISTYFDKIFIINLDFRQDKWQSVEVQLKRVGINNYERFSAVKPELSTIPAVYKENLAARNNSDGPDETYIVGGMGCKLSHIQVVKIAQERGYERTLIFEDDVVFHSNTNEIFYNAIHQLNNFEPWDMLYFTGNHGNRFQKISPNLVKMFGSHSTVGYGIATSICKEVINKAYDHPYHIDLFYKEKIHPHFNCYCIMPHLVWNAPGFSDIEQGYRDYKVLKRYT